MRLPRSIQRGRLALVFASLCGLWLACGGEGEPAEHPSEPQRAEPEARDEGPVPGFRPQASDGSCPARYRVQEALCVHEKLIADVPKEQLAQQIAAYKAGAAPPIVGARSVAAPGDEPLGPDPSKLDPGALIKGEKRDPKQVEAERLAELEERIREARIRSGELVQVDGEWVPASSLKAPEGAGFGGKPAKTTSGPDPEELRGLTAGMPEESLDKVMVEVVIDGRRQMVSAREWMARQEATAEKRRP